MSPFIMFAVFDVSFRRYNLLWLVFYIYICCFITAACVYKTEYRLPVYHNVWAGNGIVVRVGVNNWQICFKYTSSKYEYEYKYITHEHNHVHCLMMTSRQELCIWEYSRKWVSNTENFTSRVHHVTHVISADNYASKDQWEHTAVRSTALDCSLLKFI